MGKTLHLALMVLTVLFVAQSVMCAEIDRTSYVASVHDGDTFTLSTGEKVRLADLDAPELGDEGADEATDYLRSMVYQETVFLDVDDKYQTDSFGRLVCVVYVEYNSTHYLNVNEALIEGSYVEARNYDNEFNYNTFNLYLQKFGSGNTDNTSLLIPIAIVAVVVLIIFLLAKVRH